MILLIDNYDSFVFNLARYFRELGEEVEVVRNDKISISDVVLMAPDAIVLSPGPCGPDQAGNSLEIVAALSGVFPMLGVCLGHQTIAQIFGAKILPSQKPVHGKVSVIEHNGQDIFANIPSPLNVTRYHSLIAQLSSDGCLEGTAFTKEGELMAFRHKDVPVFGVQFHPEAVLTQFGHELLGNFLKITREHWQSNIKPQKV